MNRAFGESSVFQFTPLHERQHSETELMERAFVFQFTPLHERQHGKKEDGSDDFEFQFTPLHERQHNANNLFYWKKSISIHAST